MSTRAYTIIFWTMVAALLAGFLIPYRIPRMSVPVWVVVAIIAVCVPVRFVSPKLYNFVTAFWWIVLGFVLGQSIPSIWSH